MSLGAALLASAPGAGQSTSLEPLERQESVLRFFALKGDPEAGELNEALAPLAARVVQGPASAASRRGRSFVAVEGPADLEGKAVSRALRSAGAKAEELEWIAFEGRVGQDSQLPNFGEGFGGRDHVLGMSGDIRWFDSHGGWTQFYFPPGKLDAEELEERYAKLFGPYGGGTLGRVVARTFTCELAAPLEEKRVRKLVKELLRLDGVRSANIGPEGRVLEIGVELTGLRASAPAGAFPGAPAPESGGPARAGFPTGALHDLLVEWELVTPEDR